MSYKKQLVNNYGESIKNVIQELNWNIPERKDIQVYQKVNQWLLRHEEVQTEKKTSDLDSLNLEPEEIHGSPVINRRKRLKWTAGDTSVISSDKHLYTAETPPSRKRIKCTLNAGTTSPIVRRKRFVLRKKRLFQDVHIKKEIEEIIDLNNEIINSQENIDVFPDTKNSMSPVMISKRYSYRKKEKSFLIKDESFSQKSHNLPLLIENIENSPKVKKKLFVFKPEIHLTPSTISNSTQKIEQIDSEDEEKNHENENIIIENDTHSIIDVKSDFIEESYTQKSNVISKVDIISPHSQNSDETYYSIKGSKKDAINITQSSNNVNPSLSEEEKIEVKEIEVMEKISQASSFSTIQKFSNSESQLSNLHNIYEESTTKLNFSNAIKKKKCQKNSLSERLQNLIGKAASFNRLWHHQIKQKQFQELHTKYVELYIKDSYQFNDRFFFHCIVIKDEHTLLHMFYKDFSFQSITIIALPEIIGNINIMHKNYMKIYPPWNVIDKESYLIEVPHFILENLSENDLRINEEHICRHKEMKVLKFSCPCCDICKISELCKDKFTNCKPSVVDKLFNLSV